MDLITTDLRNMASKINKLNAVRPKLDSFSVMEYGTDVIVTSDEVSDL